MLQLFFLVLFFVFFFFFNLNCLEYTIWYLIFFFFVNIKSIISYYIILLTFLSFLLIEKTDRKREKEGRKEGRKEERKKGRKEGRKNKKGKQGRKVGSSGMELHSSENGLLMYFFCFPKHLFETSHNVISLEFPVREYYENCLAQQPLFLIHEEYSNCQREN